ncbi:hypothetical protein SLEP1_g26880 [Rubroshorea leprosula]|uniref:Uncharacterized protein n=1 Tax=Rubroshorea leprosula TaxID=152421 RepID=A0AAV5JY89_9ROSI|nr:hypothetical protein SLEP1_g26880 [Rubroshorea leprosula]
MDKMSYWNISSVSSNKIWRFKVFRSPKYPSLTVMGASDDVMAF